MARGPLKAMPEIGPAAKPIIQAVFLESVRRELNGCWTWTDKFTNGTPMFQCMGVGTTALKWAYHLFVQPVPARTAMRRTCDSTRCVNPAHIRLGPRQTEKAPSSPVEAVPARTWGNAYRRPEKAVRKLKAASTPPLVVNLTDSDLSWEITGHAEVRMRELGFTPNDLYLTAAHPENQYDSGPRYPEHTRIHQRGDCAVAVNTRAKVILTVLLREQGQWIHGKDTRNGPGAERPISANTPYPRGTAGKSTSADKAGSARR